MKKIILLTATVRPSNIKFSGSYEERQYEYEKAIYYYLYSTDYNIVIVDNSGFDFSSIIKNSRVEALSYYEDDKNSRFGKGYCETNILKYAFEYSHFVKECDTIIKITGRHIIKNINTILKSCDKLNTVYVDSDVHLNFSHSYFFVAPTIFFIDYFFEKSANMNDNKGIYFEHILSSSIKEWKRQYNHEQFKIPIYIIGHPGALSKPYKRPNTIRYILIFAKYYIYKFLNQ